MRFPPLDVLLAYPEPNYVDPVKRGHAMTVVNSIFLPLVLFVVGLRVYTRIRISKSFGWDDGMILASLLFAVGFMSLAFLAIDRFGSDRHVWDNPIPSLTIGLKLTIATQIIFCWASALNKISMLLLVCRILTAGTSIVRTLAKLTIILVAVDGVVYTLVVIFQCSPVHLYWALSFGPQNCINEKMHLLIAGTINTLTDFITVFLPLPVIMKLQLPRRQHILMGILFGAGAIVCVAGIVRIYYTYLLSISYDQTWDCYPVWLSSSVELYVGIIGASIPVTKPFFSRYLPRLLSSSYMTSNRSFFSKRHTHSTKISNVTGSKNSKDSMRGAEEGTRPSHSFELIPPRQAMIRAKGPNSPRPDYKNARLSSYNHKTGSQSQSVLDDGSSISSFHVNFSTGTPLKPDEIRIPITTSIPRSEGLRPESTTSVKTEVESDSHSMRTASRSGTGSRDGFATKGDGESTWQSTQLQSIHADAREVTRRYEIEKYGP